MVSYTNLVQLKLLTTRVFIRDICFIYYRCLSSMCSHNFLAANTALPVFDLPLMLNKTSV